MVKEAGKNVNRGKNCKTEKIILVVVLFAYGRSTVETVLEKQSRKGSARKEIAAANFADDIFFHVWAQYCRDGTGIGGKR